MGILFLYDSYIFFYIFYCFFFTGNAMLRAGFRQLYGSGYILYTMYKMKYKRIYMGGCIMNLNVLRYVIEVEKNRSITGAARQLFISQPNLKPRHTGTGGGNRVFYLYPQLPGRHSHGKGAGIPGPGKKGRKAVSGPGKLLHQGGTGQYQPAYLRPPRQLHHLRAHLFSQQKTPGAGSCR